jgi:hypothetical protein
VYGISVTCRRRMRLWHRTFTRPTIKFQFAMERVHRIESLPIEKIGVQTGIPGCFCFTFLSPGTLTLSVFLCLILLWVYQASQFAFLIMFRKTCQPMTNRKIIINAGNTLFTCKRSGLKYKLCATSRHIMPEHVKKYLLKINDQAPRLRK